MKSFKQLVEGLVEAWPGTKEYEAKFGKPKGMSDEGKRKGARHDIEVKDGVTKATKRFDDEDSTEAKPTEKRGRGRPAGKYGQYKKSVKESLEIMESMETQDEIAEFIDSLDEESFAELSIFLESEELDEAATPKGHTIEAHGIKGMKGTPWRKTFKSHDHLNDWVEKNDSVEVHGTRELEKPNHKNESVEQIDEVTQGKEYTHAQLMKKVQTGNWEAQTDIKPGKHVEMRHHTGKKVTVYVKEDVEQLDELSKSTLGSYAKKANQSAMSAAHAVGSKRGAASDEHINKMFKRKAGVNKAVDRLTKEDVELTESHFSLGDTVKCKESGMTGKVVKLDKEHGGETEKYYTVERSDGKTVKYAPSELSLVTENITHPNQKVLDKNKNGKLDKEDFKILRGEKEKNESFVDSIASLITKQSKGEA